MKKTETLVFTVIFPGTEKFFSDFNKSISNQTDNKFDLLIVNDNLRTNYKKEFPKAIWIDINKNLTPAKIRELIFNYAIEKKYNNVIICDIDDYFAENRIELCKKNLKEYDFVYNNLTIINEKNEIVEKDYLNHLVIPKEILNYSQLGDYNFIGMSNSAISLDKIKKIEISEKLLAVDWYLYTTLLIQGFKGKFIDTTTYYRQHENNIVGFKTLTKSRLINNISIKKTHYSSIIEFCKKNKFLKEYSFFYEKNIEIIKLEKKIKDENFIKHYIKIVNKNWRKIFKGWWSEIITLREFEKYG